MISTIAMTIALAMAEAPPPPLPAPARADAASQTLRQVPCDFPIGAERKDRMTCYRLRVPRDYSAPRLGTYELAVAILEPALPAPRTDPVLVLHGGPGGPGVVASIGRMRDDFLPGARLVAFDQRANGRSDPRVCTGLSANAYAAMAGPGDYEATARRYNAPYLECRRTLAAAGVAPDHFGVRVTSNDAEQLRRALGIRRWNVMSVSAGTLIALDMIAARPRTVRAAVLDSPVPIVSLAPGDEDYDRIFEQLFEKCRADSACLRAHPALEADFREAVRSLNERPLPVPLPGLVPGDLFDLNGAELEFIVQRLMRAPASARSIPDLIAAGKRRDTAFLAAALPSAASALPASNAFGRPAVICRDDSGFQASPPPRRGPELGNLYQVCAAWGPPGPPPRAPRRLSVPLLAMVGGLDPLIGSQSAGKVTERFGRRARSILFPSAGHGTWLEGDCPKQIAASFFRDPDAALEISCIAAMPNVALSPAP